MRRTPILHPTLKPTITALCLTFGRVDFLNESIQMFLDQTYDGPKQLLVFNTFTKQRLIGNFPNVRIMNTPERPANLGACRNAAIHWAQPGLIVIWDDDDAYLPNHLQNFADQFDEGTEWIWHSRQFYMEGFQLKQIVQGSCNSLAFTKAAWEKVGRYPDRNSGEDRDFVSKLTANCQGKKVQLKDEQLSLLYHWGQGVYHLSGEGDDQKGMPSGHDRIARYTEDLARKGAIPTGPITLQPQLRHDYVKLRDQFLAERQEIAQKKTSTCFVQLGRFGDIVNMLPIAKHCADNYAKPYLMVSREFASILDGVSYVEPYVVDLTFDIVRPAIDLAKQTFRNVIVTQIYGKDFQCERQTKAYNLESWRQAGFFPYFDQWFPVFDRRDKEREQAIVQKVKTDKPMLLINVSGFSSPYPRAAELIDEITRQWSPRFNIVNISDLRLDRPYDLLGLFDEAKFLITTDSFALHLATASKIKFIAIVNNLDWLGSATKGNCICRITYMDPFHEIHQTIGDYFVE